MKLLIEDYPYPADKVRGLLGGEEPYETDGFCRIGKVGYFYNPSIRDCVFILPKVILDEGRNTIFREFCPVDIINIDQAFREERLTIEQREFIYNLSTWIYRAIYEFARINESMPKEQQSRILYQRQFSAVSLNGDTSDGTLIDIILSLIKFAGDNRDFFMFIIKNIHSGYNKINWNRTISKKTAIINDNRPLYVELVNKKKQINFDEELLIIFYSILNYVREKFGFPINIPFNYELITGTKFESLLSGLGKSRLLQIKYKYFSDKAIKLWNLCYCFFARLEQMVTNPGQSEYLFVSNFNIVFEAMIDEIISDRRIPAELRNQRDGKIVDHIYPYESLITPDDIYYIGDSKYYKIGGSVHGNSEYKQYTYARNVIQYNLRLFLKHGEKYIPGKGYLPYRDLLTDGYNVTTNFFISSEIDKDFSYTKRGVHPCKHSPDTVSKHFNNRLFDRDTLWISHYDINFLFVLALFVAPHQSVRDEFRNELRLIFRAHIINLLNEKYEFYRFNGFPDEIESFVDTHFRELSGKMYHFADTLILALEVGADDSTVIKDKFANYFSQYSLS